MTKDIPTIEKLKALYQSIYYMEDTAIIDVICAAVIANRMSGDPVWICIIGGSSSGKTELINAICGLKFVYQLSTLTPNTLLSGMKPKKGQETSLLLQMPRTSMIVMKDLNTLISMNKEDQAAIMGQLLQVYDGEMTKSTGTGDTIQWKGKIGFVAGVTEQIHLFQQKYSTLGTRFINYTIPTQDRMKTAKRSSQIAKGIKEHRSKLQDAFTEYFDYIIPIACDRTDELPEEVSHHIIGLSDFASRARSPVARDFQGRMELVMSLEMPMRISNQIHLMGRTFMAMSDGELSSFHKRVIYEMCLFNVPKGRKLVLDCLASHESITTKAVAVELHYETERVKMWLEELNVLGIVERDQKSGGNKGDRWKLLPEHKILFEVFQNIKSDKIDVLSEEEEEMAENNSDVEAEWANI